LNESTETVKSGVEKIDKTGFG